MVQSKPFCKDEILKVTYFLLVSYVYCTMETCCAKAMIIVGFQEKVEVE